MNHIGVQSPSVQLDCPAVLNLAHAPELKDSLLAATAAGKDVVVRAAAVTQADTSCLQLLCAAAATLAREGRSLVVAEPSAAFTRVAERLGLTAVLALQQSAAPVAGSDPRETNTEK